MPYANALRHNHREQKRKRVWKRENRDSDGGEACGAHSREVGLSHSQDTGGDGGGSGRPAGSGCGLNASAQPFAPHIAPKLKEIERKRLALEAKIREKKRKLAEDEAFKRTFKFFSNTGGNEKICYYEE